MKNIKFLAVILSVAILASCGTSHDVVDGGLFQKRKYNKGYHVSKKSKVNTSTTKVNEDEIASNPIEKVDVKADPIVLETESTASVVAVESSEVATTTTGTKKTNNTSLEQPSQKSSKNTSGLIFKKQRNMTRGSFGMINPSSPVKVDQGSNVSDAQETSSNTLLLVIIAFFIPFLAVALYDGISGRFWLSLILTLLFWLPGFIYALIVILE